MNTEQIQGAADVLEWMSGHFAQLPEEPGGALQARLACELGRVLCLGLVLELSEGAEPYDAFVSVARGDRPL